MDQERTLAQQKHELREVRQLSGKINVTIWGGGEGVKERKHIEAKVMDQ